MNSRESREMKYKSRKKFHRSNNHTYQRNQSFYSGSRNYTFSNSYTNNGTAGCSKNAYHYRSTRQYQHNRKDAAEYYTDYYWQQPRKTRREPSPLNGSEEYTLRKIQETSDMIKRQLMSPENTPIDSNIRRVSEPIKKSTKVIKKSNRNSKEPSALRRKLERKAALREKFNKTLPLQKSSDTTYNVKEIHNQILNHISKLNYGRKQNLINADCTGYDAALQQIYKQKSLELSKALREMSHQEKPEASEVVNSIIPDFAIKFEELPIHVIRELSSTFEKNIGNDDISPFDFSTYSADQGLFNSTPTYEINSISQDYQNRSQITSHSNLSGQNSIDDRVLHINSEDADSLVIKKENLIASSIKIETLETIEILDDEGNGDNAAQIHSILQLQDESDIASPVDPNMLPSLPADSITHKMATDTFSDSKTAVSSETNAIIGTVRVSTSIFHNPNEQISIENKNGKQLHENQNNFITNSSSSQSIPKLRINMNIFDETNNHSSEIHSVTQNDNSGQKLNFDSSNKIIDNESSHEQITNEIISVGEHPNTSEITNEVMNNNVSFGEDPDSHLNISRVSSIISSNLSEENISSDNRNRSSIESQLTMPLFQNSIGKNDHLKKRNCDSTSFSKRYLTRGTLNAQQSYEENRNENGSFQADIGTEIPNKILSVTIKQFEKPKDIVQAAKIMMEIDSEIEKLTKLRQSIIMNLIGHKNLQSLCTYRNNKKKKKGSHSQRLKRFKRNNRNQDGVICSSNPSNQSEETCEKYTEVRMQDEDNIIDCLEKQLEEKHESHQKKSDSAQSAQSISQDFRDIIDLDINDLTGVPLICKIVHQENSLIIGTDNGKVQYFNLCIPKKPFTVRISQNAISCLECVHVGEKTWIFTGTTVESQLRAIQYKKTSNRKNISLEDGIQCMQKEWQYIFIGGSRGFLTRYNWQRNKIEFEDRISELTIMDLKATREGPRKILIILFKDEFGNKQIHVRDAMSALHIRTIGEIQTVDSMLIKDSSVFFSSNREISVYSFCDGQFITTSTVPSQGSISLLHEYGNLILAACSDGNIYAYNFRNMNLLGYFSCDLISSLVVFQDKVIFGLCTKAIRSLTIPQHILEAM